MINRTENIRQWSPSQMPATANGCLCRTNARLCPLKMPFHNDTNRGHRIYLQFQKKISGQYKVCAWMHVTRMKQNRFDQQSESKRLSVVPTCLRAGTILARASRLPSSLWSNVQSCCSGRRWSRQKTEPHLHLPTSRTASSRRQLHMWQCLLECDGWSRFAGLPPSASSSASLLRFLFFPRSSRATSSQHSPIKVDGLSSAELAEAVSALQVWVPVDTLVELAVVSRYVCGCEKLLPVFTTRPVFAGSETRDWSVLLELGDGRVMSAVAWLRFCSRSLKHLEHRPNVCGDP